MADITGADRLINSIVDEARASAAKTEEEACNAVALIKSKCEADKAVIRRECVDKAEAIRSDIISRELTNAQLTASKQRLLAKRRLIDRAFDEAYQRLAALKGDQRLAVIKRTLDSETAGGETILPAKADREQIAKLISAMLNDKIVPGKGLVLGSDAPELENGFAVKGNGFYKNCSFASLIDDARDSCEPLIAGILFGE